MALALVSRASVVQGEPIPAPDRTLVLPFDTGLEVPATPTCPASYGRGRSHTTCSLATGHDGKHRSWRGVEWAGSKGRAPARDGRAPTRAGTSSSVRPTTWPHAGADFSDDRRYRLRLWRAREAGVPFVLWVMLNPSDADARDDDPTVRTCLALTETWGFAALRVVNLFPFISTDPKALPKDAATAVGSYGDDLVLGDARAADLVVCAWGQHGIRFGRGQHVLGRLLAEGIDVRHVGLVKNGEPRHPLYLPHTTQHQPWSRL